MNDPHVDALVYRIRHDEFVDYSEAESCDFETEDFRGRSEDGTVRFQMKEHFATERDARKIVDLFARNWEFDVCLRRGPGYLKLEFDQAEITDRSPTPGVVEVATVAPVHWAFSASQPSVTLKLRTYPSPPTDINSNTPDVQTLWKRYRRYRQGREDLPSLAYFCLTVLEYPFELSSQRRKTSRKRQQAAEQFGVEPDVLNRIGELSSTKGGDQARKHMGLSEPLSPDETDFLERSVTRLIRRVAERAAGNANLPTITLSEFNSR